MAVTIDAVLTAYIKTRDELDALEEEHKKAVATLKELQAKREDWLGGELTRNGVDSLKKAGLGTVYFSSVVSASISDKQAFKDWVIANSQFDCLDLKVNKTAMKELAETGEPLPPGVNYTTMKIVRVRRGA